MQGDEWFTLDKGKIKKFSQAKGNKQQRGRKSARYVVPWEIMIVDAGALHNAVIADLSVGGVSFYYEKPLHSLKTIAVTIRVPAYQGRREVIVGAECRILYSVLSSDVYGKYRIVLKFLYFRKNGRRDLAEALANRIPIGEYPNIFAE